jgi:signal transduction histidine kinase
MRNRLKYILLSITVALALVALWQVHVIADAVRDEEEEKVRLWATAISQRASLVETTQRFFDEATLDEHRKMELYTDILQSLSSPDFNTDLSFSLRYINYIVDSSHTDIIITTAKDSMITVPQELAGQKLEGALMEEYSVNPPFNYNLWGMRMTLYYKESEYYTQLREVLDGFSRSFLLDITQNSVKVPVLIVDSSETQVLGFGNLPTALFDNQEKLQALISEMHNANEPIVISMPDGAEALVYYENTPMLKALGWLPVVYIFIALVLLFVSYHLFRTARTAEQNRIWVGLAKETAHQLGTPLSSLSGWVEYLRGKEFSDEYAAEVEKDLQRLDTITRRFSKIGSVPELKEDDVRQAVESAVDYLRNRAPRRVKFNIGFPEGEEFRAPISRHLFQWVIENLCKNAIDAMEGDERPSSTITIVASQDARKIYIDVSDTGKGMSPSVQKHIFESGFTTKNRGWGLGLPLARRIINEYHGGRLYLKYSVPDQGSTFRIVLKK